jgi:TrmH family RNA methyltransferase
MGPRDCAERMIRESAHGVAACVFGPEKTGLHNDDLDLCHTLLTIPTDPGFSSLNLAMAVQVIVYELRVAGMLDEGPVFDVEAPPATSDEMEHFYTHLENVLRDIRFLDPDNPRHLMRRMRRLFIRARPDKNEINILRGILTAIDRTRGDDEQ